MNFAMDEWEERNTIVSVVNIILSGWGGKKKRREQCGGKRELEKIGKIII